MTHKFKIGDEVLMAHHTKKYKITELDDYDRYYFIEPVVYDGRIPHWVHEDRLELVNKPKFKVGDRVRIKSEGMGFTYEITFCFGTGEYDLSNTICGLSAPHCIDGGELELVTKHNETEMEKPKFKVGDTVRIKVGSLADAIEDYSTAYEIISIKGTRAVIKAYIDGMGCEVHLETCDLELVDDRLTEPDKSYDSMLIDRKKEMLYKYGEGLGLCSIYGNVSPDAFEIDLPDNFFKCVSMSINKGKISHSLLHISPKESETIPSPDGAPCYFYTSNGKILIHPIPDTNYEYSFVYKGLNDELMRIFSGHGNPDELAEPSVESGSAPGMDNAKVLYTGVELERVPEKPAKPKVTFIGLEDSTHVTFHLRQSCWDALKNDKLFGICRDILLCEISVNSLFLLSKIGYDIEIIGDGIEEYKNFVIFMNSDFDSRYEFEKNMRESKIKFDAELRGL